MSCEKNQPQIPKLRFPNFVDEWKNFYLNDLSEKIGDGLHSTPNYVNKSKYFFINGNNLINGNIILNNNTKCISSEEFQKYNNNLTQNTLLLSINGTIGNLSFYNDENVILGKSVAFINLKENINKFFIYYLFQTNKIKYYFKNELTGTTIKNLSLKSLKNTNIKIPSLKEQKKIGDFLSKIDKKLFLMEQKLSLYQNIKEYYLNKIYEQKFINQKSYIIEDIVDLISIRKYQIKKSEIKQDGVFPVVDQGKETIAGYFDDESKVFKDVPIIIYGDHTTNLKYMEKPFIVGGDGVKLLKLNNNMDLKYIYYAFISNNINSEGYKRHFSIFKNKEIGITEDIKKQNKIGNLFYSMDILLNIMKNKIKILKRYKQGLLQRMFV